MQNCPVVRIKSSHLETQGEFVEINEADFDSEKGHVLFYPEVKDAEPAKATKPVPTKKGNAK